MASSSREEHERVQQALLEAQMRREAEIRARVREDEVARIMAEGAVGDQHRETGLASERARRDADWAAQVARSERAEQAIADHNARHGSETREARDREFRASMPFMNQAHIPRGPATSSYLTSNALIHNPIPTGPYSNVIDPNPNALMHNFIPTGSNPNVITPNPNIITPNTQGGSRPGRGNINHKHLLAIKRHLEKRGGVLTDEDRRKHAEHQARIKAHREEYERSRQTGTSTTHAQRIAEAHGFRDEDPTAPKKKIESLGGFSPEVEAFNNLLNYKQNLMNKLAKQEYY